MIDFGLSQGQLAQLGAACLAAMLALPLLPVLRLELAKFRGRCSAFTAALLVMCLFKAFVVGGMKTNVVNNLPPRPLQPTLQPIHGGVSVPLNPAFGFQLSSLTPAPQVSQKEIAVRSWNICGAWDDSFWCDFGDGFVFPDGTNHLSGVEVLACGEVWRTPFDDGAVAALGVPVSIVPGTTAFSCGATTNGSFRFDWTDAAVGRDAGSLMTASMELFRNGDVAVTTNGATSYVPRTLPFPHHGFGQDAEWVEANFTNAAEILSAGYPQWVDAQVGVGLTNGLYKLTVSLSDDPPETTFLSVGGLSVAVTNACECVFLLEKGIEYPLSVFPRDATNFVYSAVDDVLPAPPQLRGPVNSPRYSVRLYSQVQPSEAEIVVPSCDGDGHVVYVPQLCVVPEDEPDPVFPVMLGAAVFDIPFGREASYVWSGEGISETGPNFLWSGDEDVDCINVEATYGDVTVYGSVCVERHVLESEITLSGGGLLVIEDSYTNAPGDVVAAGSTSAALGMAWALAEEGTLRLDSSCAGSVKVMEDLGDGVLMPVALPCEWQHYADAEGSADFLVSVTNMAATGDIGAVTLTFTPTNGGAVLYRSVGLRAVKVRVEALADWPSNKVRHVFGPKEVFSISQTPRSPELSYSVEEGSLAYVCGHDCIAPDRGGQFSVQYSGGGCSGNLSFVCIEPTGLRGGNPRALIQRDWNILNVVPLQPGELGVSVYIDTWVMPDYVSFSNIRLFEGFALASNRAGWYQDENMFPASAISHDYRAGASLDPTIEYSAVDDVDNRTLGGDYVAALIGMANNCDYGSYQLEIPLRWYAVNGLVTNNLPDNVQRVWVYSNGTMRINKNGITWERQLNGLEYQVEELK